MSEHVCMYIHMQAYTRYTYACLYVYVYMYMYICMCICIWFIQLKLIKQHVCHQKYQHAYVGPSINNQNGPR